MSLTLVSQEGESYELSLRGVYPDLELVALELKAEDGRVYELELEIKGYR